MKYLSLDYRSAFDNESYEYDPDLELEPQEKELISAEIEHLKKNKWNIISIDLSYGCIVVVDRIDIDSVPYIKLQPDSWICGKGGHICEWCNDRCDEWKTCPDGAKAEREHQER